ncbi:zinc ribbon domain-containing protein [Paenibacillus sp. FSL H8-0548]|uniref:zinc ribbon domain-containing protein n=1 Tax=Paenibacillus sp. FSL H8-0548 TaxID=1920422 RepID=UPI0009F81C9A|nr:zinc ribbon domain-containing protein [Paenibacillus sp. FSL H8-0548]
MSRQLHYKADWYSRSIKEAPTFAPSSQACHVCGYRNADVKNLGIRRWECSTGDHKKGFHLDLVWVHFPVMMI